MNYETLLNIAREISSSKDPEEVYTLIVRSVKARLDAKGCTLFMLNRKTHELEVTASEGLSREYLDKGSINALRSIAESLNDGPVAIYDVSDDPRLQYPEQAVKEGIASILSAPIMVRDHPVGALRVYTSTRWEFTLEDVNFVQAIAQLAGMRIELAQMYKGMSDSIDLLKSRSYEKQAQTSAH